MAVKTFGSERLLSTDINTYLANAGLVYVGGGNLTGAATSFDACFSSTYRNYKIFVGVDACAANVNIQFRLRSGGVDAATNYSYGFLLIDSAGTANLGSNGTTSALVNVYYTSGGSSISEFTLADPFRSITTSWTGNAGHYYTAGARANTFGGAHYVSASYTGITILSSSALTGTARIYGVREP